MYSLVHNIKVNTQKIKTTNRIYHQLKHFHSLKYNPQPITPKTSLSCQYCCRWNSALARVNYVNIQMLSPSLQKQIFKEKTAIVEEKALEKAKEHLQKHALWDKPSMCTENVDIELPNFLGNNVADHFDNIAKKQTSEYFGFAEHMANSLTELPPIPSLWQYSCGWTKYNKDGSFETVVVPDEDVLVFDVEVCIAAGNVPILATAASKQAWYCWVSDYLISDNPVNLENVTPDCMIPMEFDSTRKKLLIGHHVAFDRAFVQEQYQLQTTGTRFLDTLSLHVCVSGVTNEQRNYLNSKKPAVLYDWMEHGTTNSLAKVYEFYCGETLDKSIRDLFVKGSLDDIRQNFQECVHYCAKDVQSTQKVFEIIWPMFLQHAPNRVTFAGMLEMGTSYLPIDDSWNMYVKSSEEMYNKVTQEMKQSLMNVAENTLKLMVNKRYKDDPWLWNLDWSLHKTVEKTMPEDLGVDYDNVEDYINRLTEGLSEKRRNSMHLPGYPKWYRDLCMRPKDPNYAAGPVKISSQTKVTPSLLRMTWDGYPLHHQKNYGWGYLVPANSITSRKTKDQIQFPFSNFKNVVSGRSVSNEKKETNVNIVKEMYKSDNNKQKNIDIKIPGVIFYQLPHKDGEMNNVGNPLAKDFLGKIEDGTLISAGGYNAKQPIQMNKMLAFWRNGRKRVTSQMTVWLKDEDPSSTSGVILPQVITAGTVTRRAVEPTWLTASNPLPDRIGSELKSMVRSPPGYCFVGADVDSQELWIASILGDAQFAQIHGCTALSWMTLQGRKTDGTDLHSRTADTIGMSRDQAKIFNYGRVYGAGERFAVRLLMQFNHQLTSQEAEERAAKLYQSTKGSRCYKLTAKGKSHAGELNIGTDSNDFIEYHDFKKLLHETGNTWDTRGEIVELNKVWYGGSESDMFNKLESIALSEEPRTPVLNCMITKALLPKHVHHYYKTSRVNWVVQSSAVDYLHLLLTCMKWLIDEYHIDARFSISIHDEVRYIVSEKDKYRAALALQISNLLTRSMFAFKLGLYDLPQCVAFFSSIDVDTVLRKEVDLDCITPSNPRGLMKGHNIGPGESLDIYDLLKKTNGGELDAT